MRFARKNLYSLLRWVTLLIGLPVCAIVLAQHGRALPWPETVLLASIRLGLLFRNVVMRRDATGRPVLHHKQGEALVLIALLRHGPAEAMAVSLISNAVYYTFYRLRGKPHLLRRFSDTFYGSAVTWIGGVVYYALGGHSVLTNADSGRFYQDFTAILFPLLGMLVFVHELIHRTYTSLQIYAYSGTPFWETWKDPFFSCFEYVEALCGVLLVVQWTAWGWGTVPFVLLLNESLLLSARIHFDRLDARRDAEVDPLTGLASWRGIENYLHRQVARARQEPVTFAMLFLDADGLKMVNDRLGHAAGDTLITVIAECCRLSARKRDLVGRRSGDEFLVVLEGVDRHEAERARMRLQRAIADTLAMHPLFGDVSGVSIGLAVFPDDASDPDALIAVADREMYRDKEARKTLMAAR